MTEIQKQRCHEIIHGAAIKAGVAGAGFGIFGTIGAFTGDAVAMSAIEIAMIIKLGNVFGREISDSVATSIAGAVTATLVGKGAASILASIPGIGAVANSAASSGTVELIGWAVADGFDKGEF